MDETMSREPMTLKVINKWKIEVSLQQKQFFSHLGFEESYSMTSYNHILIM